MSGERPHSIDFPEIISPYRAPFVELGRDQFVAEGLERIKDLVSPQFELGTSLEPKGQLRFRNIHLPVDPQERARVLALIRQHGCDRITPDPELQSNVLYAQELSIMQEIRKNLTGLNPFFLFNTIDDGEFARQPSADLLDYYTKEFRHNATLVYDTVTEKGIYQLHAVLSTFRTPSRRNEALLGIVSWD